MNDTIIVATDLGAFKAYRLDHTERNTPRLELVEEMELVDGHGKLGDKVTDQAGRYSVPTQSMAMSYGERQKIGLEAETAIDKASRRTSDAIGSAARCEHDLFCSRVGGKRHDPRRSRSAGAG